MINPMVSILIPVHNEENSIEKVIKTLLKIKKEEYNNIEIVVGSDSTDNTDKIVRKFNSVKLITSKERLGKAGMLELMYRAAKGEIIIIHDADLLLVSNNNFKNLINYFEDPKIGGIENYTLYKFDEKDNFLIFGESFIVKWLHDYKVKRQSKIINGKLFVKSNEFPFFVNIFRKSAVKQDQITICDDGERTIQIIRNGYRVAIPQDDILPYFSSKQASPSIRQFLRHKVRGQIARKQIQQEYKDYNASLLGFYLPAFSYTVGLAFKLFFGVFSYWILSLFAVVLSKKEKQMSTKEGWKMRLKR